MTQQHKVKFEDIDFMDGIFPKPLSICIRMFKSEFLIALRALIARMDLVTKEEFLVQKRLLDKAYGDLEILRERLNSEGK